MISELNHRVKNILVVVTAIARRTLKRTSSLEDFQTTFEGRMAALRRAYGILSEEDWGEVAIRDVFTGEMKPVGAETFKLEGPDLRLSPQQGLSLALIAHELTTNATKYGALSVEGGTVTVRWNVEGDRLQLNWD